MQPKKWLNLILETALQQKSSCKYFFKFFLFLQLLAMESRFQIIFFKKILRTMLQNCESLLQSCGQICNCGAISKRFLVTTEYLVAKFIYNPGFNTANYGHKSGRKYCNRKQGFSNQILQSQKANVLLLK